MVEVMQCPELEKADVKNELVGGEEQESRKNQHPSLRVPTKTVVLSVLPGTERAWQNRPHLQKRISKSKVREGGWRKGSVLLR